MVLAQGLLFSYFFLYMYLYKWKGLECSVVICWCYILHLFSLITESARWFWADVFLFLTAVEHFILRFAICDRKEICGWGKNPIMVLYSIVWSVNIPAELHVGKTSSGSGFGSGSSDRSRPWNCPEWCMCLLTPCNEESTK